MTWKKSLVFMITAFLFVCCMPAVSGAEGKDCKHDWKLASTKEPTCTAEGKKVYKCKLCGDKKTESIPALGHDWSYCTVLQFPTCTENGVTRCYCSRNASHVKDEIQPALGHKWGDWYTVLSPGLTSAGKNERICERCQAKDEMRIAPLIQKKEYDLAWMVYPDETVEISADRVSSEDLTQEWICAAANTGKNDLWLCIEGTENEMDRILLSAGEVTLLPLRFSCSGEALLSAGENQLEARFQLFGESEAGIRVFESAPVSRFIRILSSDAPKVSALSSVEIRQNLLSDENNKNSYVPGTSFQYSVAVANTGAIPLSRVELRDAVSGGKAVLENLLPGETRTIQLEKTVIRQDAVNGYLCWITEGQFLTQEGQESSWIQSNPLIVPIRAE